MICPPDHKHAETTSCIKNHGCACTPCQDGERARHTPQQRQRRRLKAYGLYEGRVPALGTQRRIQGLLYLGWTLAHIGEIAGVSYGAVGNIFKRETIEPETRDYVSKAFAQLIAKGTGPSPITRRRARARGYVSPFAWDDIDYDDKPVYAEPKRELRGEDRIAEIDHLVSMGESPDSIAKALGKTRDNLERFAWRHHRNDLAGYIRERNAA